MIERLNPTAVHAPLGGYCHTIKVPAGSELVFVAGQVGADRDGVIADGARAQTRQALSNLATCLAAHGLSAADIVRLTVYLTDRAHTPEMREERCAVFGDHALPTSTLLIVSGLAIPELLVEIDAVAVHPPDEAATRSARQTAGEVEVTVRGASA